MLYLSIALMTIATIFTIRPPSFTFKKVIVVRHEPITTTTSDSQTPNNKEVKELMEDKPPTYDDIVSSLNEVFHEIGGDE